MQDELTTLWQYAYFTDEPTAEFESISNTDTIIIDYDLGRIVGKSLTGDQAIEDILSINPDIVIVDLLLPQIDGIELVKHVKERKEKMQKRKIGLNLELLLVVKDVQLILILI